MHLSFANVNAAAPFAFPIPHSPFPITHYPFPIPQLGIGIGNWQHFHIGNIIYPLYTFYTAKNMIRAHSVNSVHSRFFVPSRWLPSCFRSNAYIKQNRRILKLEGYGDSAD